nr:MAG TPA: hypothetical protein [Caudoviricetes sp.]
MYLNLYTNVSNNANTVSISNIDKIVSSSASWFWFAFIGILLKWVGKWIC